VYLNGVAYCIPLFTRKLAIADRSRVNCAQKVTAVNFRHLFDLQSHSMSLLMVRFDEAYMISYYASIVTTALSCIVSQIYV